MTALREKMVRDMQLRRLSDNTQRVYTHAVFALAKHYMQAPDRLNERQIQDYVLYMLNVRKLAWSTCDTNVAGLQFFYGVTLGRNSMRLVLPPRKSEKRLPEILSAEEISRLFAATHNLKHRVLLETAYSAGLRASELVRLKLTDIDSGRMMIRVGQGKGNKDRYTLLSPRVLRHLRNYRLKYHPSLWLFQGQKPDRPLDRVSALSRVAISNNRIFNVEYGQVTFAFRDRAAGDKRDIMTLPAEEFIRRFLLHTLPSGFVRIRHFGFLANRAKKNDLTLCRQLLGVPPQSPAPGRKSDEELLHELTGEDFFRCPCCKQGAMRIVAELPKPGFSSFDTS